MERYGLAASYKALPEMQMSSPLTVAVLEKQRFAVTPSLEQALTAGLRRIAFRASGRQHGPITRLVSPSDIGEQIKPFVFLDHGEIEPTGGPLFRIHPHPRNATPPHAPDAGNNHPDPPRKHP